MNIEKQNNMNGFEIYNLGRPDFDTMTKTEKRLLLLPLVDTIRNFYKDENNRAKYEKWKNKRQSENP